MLQTATGEIRLLKMANLNVEENKSFSSNCFCSSKFVCVHMKTNHPNVVRLNQNDPFTVLHDFAYHFLRKLMFCSTNFVTKKKIDECLSACLSNISFNITCSVTHLHTTPQKVNRLKFAYVLKQHMPSNMIH